MLTELETITTYALAHYFRVLIDEEYSTKGHISVEKALILWPACERLFADVCCMKDSDFIYDTVQRIRIVCDRIDRASGAVSWEDKELATISSRLLCECDGVRREIEAGW